ncbi:hypothetical protein P8452_65449 [Trifolium repens]|nr:hypothetical protein P8452_65449 [Trifolium repens]
MPMHSKSHSFFSHAFPRRKKKAVLYLPKERILSSERIFEINAFKVGKEFEGVKKQLLCLVIHATHMFDKMSQWILINKSITR